MDINIQGPGVAVQHCYIENRSGVITLHPCGNLCAVDGLQVSQPVRLSQGRIQPEQATHSWMRGVALSLASLLSWLPGSHIDPHMVRLGAAVINTGNDNFRNMMCCVCHCEVCLGNHSNWVKWSPMIK